MVSISVIIPSIRDVSLNEKCLKRQTFTNFETIITRPVGEKPKGLFYTLSRDYNRAFRQARGELIISYQDLIEIKPDCLQRFWEHYQNDKTIIVGAIGDQYSNFNPPIKTWVDPRRRLDYGSFYQVNPIDIEFTLCAIPKKAIYEAGGIDEEYDFGSACGEKEMVIRMDRLGYKPYTDQSIEYRALSHPRLTEDWDSYYRIASDIFARHVKELNEGKRSLKLDYV